MGRRRNLRKQTLVYEVRGCIKNFLIFVVWMIKQLPLMVVLFFVSSLSVLGTVEYVSDLLTEPGCPHAKETLSHLGAVLAIVLNIWSAWFIHKAPEERQGYTAAYFVIPLGLIGALMLAITVT